MKIIAPHMFSLSERDAKRRFVVFLLFVAALSLVLNLLSPLALSPDEAHYWEWSRRLDLSYYSKGPTVAYLIRASTALLGDTTFAVRLPALLCMLAFWILLFFTMLSYARPGVALAHVFALASSLLFTSHHLILTTDPPAALGWVAALSAAVQAVRRPGWWSVALLLVGVTMLSKYTALTLLLSFALFFIVERRSPLSWPVILGGVLFSIALSPIILWNIQNGWVNFGHNASHVSGGFQLRPRYLGELFLGQLGLIGPVLLPMLLMTIVHSVRTKDPLSRLFLFSSVPLLFLCLGVSLTKSVYANWPMPIYIGAILLSARVCNEFIEAPKWLDRGVKVNLALLLPVLCVYSGATFGIPAKILPTKKLVGWQSLGARVESELSSLSRPFVLTENYDVASAIAFYTPSHPEVFCWVFDGRRMNQYDVWGGFPALAGRSAVIVLKNPENIERIRPHFRSVKRIGDEVKFEYSGAKLRSFVVFLGEGFDGAVPPVPVKR